MVQSSSRRKAVSLDKSMRFLDLAPTSCASFARTDSIALAHCLAPFDALFVTPREEQQISASAVTLPYLIWFTHIYLALDVTRITIFLSLLFSMPFCFQLRSVGINTPPPFARHGWRPKNSFYAAIYTPRLAVKNTFFMP